MPYQENAKMLTLEELKQVFKEEEERENKKASSEELKQILQQQKIELNKIRIDEKKRNLDQKPDVKDNTRNKDNLTYIISCVALLLHSLVLVGFLFVIFT